ncbi:hypothetical protein GCM10009678_88360 [Actinomadura kijaniata]|uniref:Uncharacterized protein n=1 Tax=Actinomadura namibiensis TaxID=182080 RepID=A0A7W3LKN1_ACTNM|nr:hypothetical protein [Actinomadura namibiensis]MBA8949879.1 hypothetical protein [Actinomadura namibiensis]
MRPDREERAACPVCGCLVRAVETGCAECSWELNTSWRFGAPDVAAFEARLAGARRAHDLAAAVRAGLTAGAPVRGGAPSPDEWDRARAAAAPPPVSDRPLRAALAEALDRLRPGRPVTVVEVGAAGLVRTDLTADGLGVPRGHDAATRTSWDALAPMLARDPAELRFQLAGGLADLDRRALWAALSDTLPRGLGGDVLLVRREPGWPVPDRAVHVLRRRHPHARVVSAGRRGATEILRELMDALPIRHTVGLAAAALEPGTRRLIPALLPLFPPGTRPGAETTVTLRRPPGDAPTTVLAAVAAHGDRWDLLTCVETAVSDTVTVHAALGGPRDVRLTAPGLTPRAATLPDLLDAIPPRLEILTEPVDLLVAIELGGLDGRVRRRLDLVRDLLRAVDPALVRAAVYGYRDHAYGRGREGRPVLDGEWLAPVAAALDTLDRLRPSLLEYTDAAPLEDALTELAQRANAAPPPRRAVLLTVASRPPHPQVQGDGDVLPCQFERGWQTALWSLVGRTDAACVTVLDGEAFAADRAWHDLGRAARLPLDGTDARRLGTALGLLPSVPQTLSLPLAETERGPR